MPDINEPVSVLAWCDRTTHKIVPYVVRWQGRDYRVKEVGYPHSYREGRERIYVFAVNVGALDMELRLDCGDRVWTLLRTTDEFFR